MVRHQPARHVLADCAHDAGYFRDAIGATGAEPVIPPHPTRKHAATRNRQRYRARNRIERLVSRPKRFRRIAARYGRRALYLPSAIQVVATLERMPPHIESTRAPRSP